MERTRPPYESAELHMLSYSHVTYEALRDRAPSDRRELLLEQAPRSR